MAVQPSADKLLRVIFQQCFLPLGVMSGMPQIAQMRFDAVEVGAEHDRPRSPKRANPVQMRQNIPARNVSALFDEPGNKGDSDPSAESDDLLDLIVAQIPRMPADAISIRMRSDKGFPARSASSASSQNPLTDKCDTSRIIPSSWQALTNSRPCGVNPRPLGSIMPSAAQLA